ATALACAPAPPARPAPPLSPTPTPTQTPAPDDERFAAVVAYLRSQVDSAYPGAVLAVGERGRLVLLTAVGHYGIDDRRPVGPETVYDLASLTKVIGLTTACMLLVDQGKLDLAAPVQRYVPAFRGAGKDRVTIRHLLTHSSGLPPWRPLYTEATTRTAAFTLVDTTPLAADPGTQAVYSDLGAILLTQVVETITGERIDRFLDRHVFGPLAMTSTRFLPPPGWHERIAPTERSQDGTIIRGTVHDENAWKLGGVSGHAGLFSTAPDLARFGFWLLDSYEGRRRAAEGGEAAPTTPAAALRRLSPPLVREFTRRQELPPGSSRALGWDTPSGLSSAGTKLGPRAFGHTGFTGTSIWFDPDRSLVIILLTNRVHPTRENGRIAQVRRQVADLVVDAFTREASPP
ncbi:MAG: serine hydrolase domain-containing protein, partial [Gemmatimonadales bacterium]